VEPEKFSAQLPDLTCVWLKLEERFRGKRLEILARNAWINKDAPFCEIAAMQNGALKTGLGASA
jgi:hypothetical protein